MGRVLFHTKRRACHLASGVLLVTLASLALLQGSAHAAVTAVAAPPNGTINQPTPQSQSFNGNVAGNISSATDCSLSDLNAVGTCSQFDLEVGTAGSVDVVINWITGLDDLDLYVFLCDTSTAPTLGVVDTNGNTVCTFVQSSTMPQGTLDAIPAEGLTFNAAATLIPSSFYRVIVVPFAALDETYTGCAGYSGQCGPVPGQTPPSVPPSTFFAGCTGETANSADRSLTGGAEMLAPDGQNKAHATMNVRRKNGQLKGKVNYKVDDPTKFKSDALGCAAFTDGSKTNQSNTTIFEGKVDVRGIGTLQQTGQPKQQVCFEAHGTDNGEPGSGRDQFDITFYPVLVNGECSTTPLPVGQPPTTITGGNLDYHFYCKDD